MKNKKKQIPASQFEENYQNLLAILESYPEYLYISDPVTYEVLFVNKKMIDVLPAPPIGNLCYEVFQGLDIPCSFCTNHIILKTRKPHTWEFYNEKLDKYFLITDQIIKWPDGRDVRFEIAVDISERKIAEDTVQALILDLENRVNQRTELLEQANKDLESFAYSVSHDLKAPLRHISGFLSLLKKSVDQDPKEVGKYIKKIEAATKHMGTLISELLIYSRVGKKKINFSTVDVNQLVTDIFREVKEGDPKLKISLKIDKINNIRGDIILLRIVFQNLIHNAIKFSSPRKEIKIKIGAKKLNENLTEIFIQDNGVGFDSEFAENLFGVFQRMHTTDEFPGTGIGLAIVKRIAVSHGGSVRAEAAVNKGACFFVTLPTTKLLK